MTEGKLLVQDKDIAVPGETLATGMNFVPGRGTYRNGENVVACVLGSVYVENNVVKLTQLSGPYIPRVNDVIVGRVDDILMSGWRFSINSPYCAVMNVKDATSEFIERGADLSRYFSLGEYVTCKIINVTSQMLVDATMVGPGLRKLIGGRLVVIGPQKVPRVIGKAGSMVKMIKDMTGCHIYVGQNGWIWVGGENPEKEIIAIETIKLIEREAHTSGLTDRVKAFLEQKVKI